MLRTIKTLTTIYFILLMAGVSVAATTPETPAQDPLNVSGPEIAAQTTFQTMEDGRLLVSVTDAEEKPLLGLTPEQFTIRRGTKTAKITGVEPLTTNKELGLNIVLVVDNSKSMRFRSAVDPLSNALQAFYKTLRPIDSVTAIVFDDKETTMVDGRALHAKAFQSNDPDQISGFIEQNLRKGLTGGTYLFDAMIVGLDLTRRMPAKDNKFLVVFSDGEDINSGVTREDVEKAAGGIENLGIYAVDYMPAAETDPFLTGLSSNHHGRVWKATSAEELLPVFEAFSSTLLHRYVVSYRFLDAPKGTLAFAVPQLTIEEVTTIDSAPLLNHIYFETGQSELADRYAMFANAESTKGFEEKNLKGAMEKYRHVLNIIGRRLQQNPVAKIRLVGCNANTGEEKGRTDLSRSRAEAVRAYLRYVWGVTPDRITVEPRNLPQAPSTNRIAEGQAENQRVEIYADNPAILDTVDSAYVQKVSDLSQLRIVPQIQAEAGLTDWQVNLFCGNKEIRTIKGQGDLPSEWSVPLEAALLEEISTCDAVQMNIHATDTEANEMNSQESVNLPVNYIQRTEQSAEVQGYKVLEQYALILFDYDSAAIKDRNQAIVERILRRMEQVPEARVSVVGHTDTIGSETYNLKLSDRRAQAVKETILAAAANTADRLEVKGVGPGEPLYDNQMPEGRALNRTVTITLEYTQK